MWGLRCGGDDEMTLGQWLRVGFVVAHCGWQVVHDTHGLCRVHVVCCVLLPSMLRLLLPTAGQLHPHRNGTEILLNDARPSGELLLATGSVPDTNASDFLMWDVSMLQVGEQWWEGWGREKPNTDCKHV